jgi:hypothetical protein
LLQVYTLWFIYLEPKKVLAVWMEKERHGKVEYAALRCCQLERLIAADWAN